MYHDNWWISDPPARMPSESIDWKRITEADHHWNVEELHAYLDSMVGQKLWPNPHVWLVMEWCAPIAKVHLALKDATK